MKPLVHIASFFAALSMTAVCHSQAKDAAVDLKKLTIDQTVQLHYVDQGAGEPIVFVHGLTADYSDWLNEVEAFAEEGFRAIAYSRRHNYPNDNALRPRHSAEVEAGDLDAFVRKLDLGKVHVVAHSFGAYAALIFALEHPERIRTLTLAEPPLAPWLSTLSNKFHKQDAMAHSQRLLRQGVLPARLLFQQGRDSAAMEVMFDAITGNEGSFTSLPLQVKSRRYRNLQDMKAVVLSDRAYTYVERNRVRRCKVPTLLLSGSKSTATARYTDAELESLLPKDSCQRIMIDGASHIMWVEQPEQCRKAVLEFIERHSK